MERDEELERALFDRRHQYYQKLAKEDISRIVTSLLEHEDTENSINFEESQYEVFSPLNVGGGGSQYSNYHHELHDDTDQHRTADSH